MSKLEPPQEPNMREIYADFHRDGQLCTFQIRGDHTPEEVALYVRSLREAVRIAREDQ